jgi:hypothetical protein
LIRRGRRKGRRRCAAALLIAAVTLFALAACGGGATDANEPNDDPNAATELVPGTPVEGVLTADDSDVFRCDATGGRSAHPFVVTVLSDAPQDIRLQVGASVPGAWEGITWPGWEAVVGEDRLEVAGELRKGTVLMFLKGADGTSCSIDIAWD